MTHWSLQGLSRNAFERPDCGTANSSIQKNGRLIPFVSQYKRYQYAVVCRSRTKTLPNTNRNPLPNTKPNPNPNPNPLPKTNHSPNH